MGFDDWEMVLSARKVVEAAVALRIKLARSRDIGLVVACVALELALATPIEARQRRRTTPLELALPLAVAAVVEAAVALGIRLARSRDLGLVGCSACSGCAQTADQREDNLGVHSCWCLFALFAWVSCFMSRAVHAFHSTNRGKFEPIIQGSAWC